MAPPPRAPLSVAIITKNAATQLRDCLTGVSFADDIVVLDGGSGDATRAIAESMGARVEQTADWPGFGRQKQRAVALARHDWVLCLDADERVGPRLRASIEAALGGESAGPDATTPRFNAYRMARANRFMGRVLRHGEGYPDWSLRLFHRGHARWSDDLVHEKVETETAIGTLDGDLLHESAESLDAYLAKQNRYTTLQVRDYSREANAPGSRASR